MEVLNALKEAFALSKDLRIFLRLLVSLDLFVKPIEYSFQGLDLASRRSDATFPMAKCIAVHLQCIYSTQFHAFPISYWCVSFKPPYHHLKLVL